MLLKSEASIEKLSGRYYTPISLARFIVQWGLNENAKEILEPSCGDGVFLDAIKEMGNHDFSCTGVEISTEEANKARSRILLDNRFEIITTDFYEYYKEYNHKTFDFIVGNPPYIRYQYLTEEQRNIQSKLLIKNNLKPNKLINAMDRIKGGFRKLKSWFS